MADAQLVAQLKLDATQYNQEMKKATEAAKSASVSIDKSSQSVDKLEKEYLALSKATGYTVDGLGRIHDASGKFAKTTDETAAKLRELRSQLKSAGVGVEEFTQPLNTKVPEATGHLRSLTSAVIGYVSVQKLIAASDEWTTLNNRIRLVTSTQEEFATAQSGLVSISQNTGQALGSIGQTYQSLARSQKELGLTQKEVLQLTDTISKTMVIGGGTAEGNAAALIQLSQAFSSGVLRGEEFNSVMEQAPALAKTMAEGLGVPVGALRQMASDGKLTADAVSKAILKMSKDVDSQFKTVDLTISQSLTVLNTGFTEFIGKTSDASGAASRVSGAIQLLGKNIDIVANALMVFAGVKITAMAFSAAIAITKLSASYVAKAQAARAAAIATEGTALAITQASLAAWRGAPAVTTFAGSLQVLTGASRTATASMSGFAAASGAAVLPLASVASAFIGIQAAIDFMNDRSADNWFHKMANNIAGLDNETESLGTKLADLLNDDYGNFSSKKSFELGVSLTPIGQSKRAWDWLFGDDNAEKNAKVNIELPSKGSIEIQENISDIKKQFTDLSANIGLSSEQIKINTAVKRIEEEQAKAGNSEATIAVLKRAEADVQGAQAALDKYNADKAAADEVKRKTELDAQNAKAVEDMIAAKEREVATYNMTSTQMAAYDAELKGATLAQQNHLSELQAVTEAYKSQKEVMKSLDDIIDGFNTAGMSAIDKQLYRLEQKGATSEQLATAKYYLEATESITQAAKDESASIKQAENESKKKQEKEQKAAEKMLLAAEKMDKSTTEEVKKAKSPLSLDGKSMSFFKGSGWFNDHKDKDPTGQNYLKNAYPEYYGKGGVIPKAGGGGYVQSGTGAVDVKGMPNSQSQDMGTINISITNEQGIAKLFPLLGAIQTLTELKSFVDYSIGSYGSTGAAANA